MPMGKITSLDYISQLPKRNDVTTVVTVMITPEKHSRPVVASIYIPKKLKKKKDVIDYLKVVFPGISWGDENGD